MIAPPTTRFTSQGHRTLVNGLIVGIAFAAAVSFVRRRRSFGSRMKATSRSWSLSDVSMPLTIYSFPGGGGGSGGIRAPDSLLLTNGPIRQRLDQPFGQSRCVVVSGHLANGEVAA